MAAVRFNYGLLSGFVRNAHNLIGQQRLYSTAAVATQSNEKSAGNGGTSKMNMLQAINNALDIAMENDDSAVLFGEDVGFGGVFRCSLNLQVRFMLWLFV